MSSIQLLVATMHQHDFSKIENMNIQSNCVFANQSDETAFDQKNFQFGLAKMITTDTRGVGVNRNLTLLYSDADILLFADDDLQYVDGYSTIVKEAFAKQPSADGIIFNIETVGVEIGRRKNTKFKRIRWYNAFNYGAARLAVRRNSIIRENVFFNTNFGGGTSFSSGEDTLYIVEMLKKKLKLYTCPITIAVADQTSSTWFNGYTKKYYYDKGVLFATVNRHLAKLLCLQDLIRHPNYKSNNMTFKQAYSMMKKGIKGQKQLIPYKEGI